MNAVCSSQNLHQISLALLNAILFLWSLHIKSLVKVTKNSLQFDAPEATTGNKLSSLSLPLSLCLFLSIK